MNGEMHLGQLVSDFERVRAQTQTITARLTAEDQCVQSMPDASPVKWHRAHTTWFFETFVLRPAGHEPLSSPSFDVFFNSYYNAVGEQYHRPSRGLLTRPTHDEVTAYRDRVDDAMASLLAGGVDEEQAARIELGLHHEQQHQELIVTDVKHLLSFNPTAPAYCDDPLRAPEASQSLAHRWSHHEGGVVSVGFAEDSFHFDNEGPAHDVLLQPFSISQRLVTNREYLEFMADGGYERPELWLSAGWNQARENQWRAPLYWGNDGESWSVFSLHGRGPVGLGDPVTHVSYFEADAYARWAGSRLPTEQEWEAATSAPEYVALGDKAPWTHASQPRIYGACWQWTQSSYAPYPRYRPAAGAIGEYNGKFMCGQYVLRGSSFATPAGHARRTYRNFFPPDARWQLSGIRLARDEG
ncbi:MAG: ergothioneine biosynthesis protein EgtB [Polyangiales bacterium]